MKHKFKHAFTVLLYSYIITLILPTIFIFAMYFQVLDATYKDFVNESLASLHKVQTSLDREIQLLTSTSRQIVLEHETKQIMHYGSMSPSYPYIYDLKEYSDSLSDKLSFSSDIIHGYQIIFFNNELIFHNSLLVTGLNFFYDNYYKYDTLGYENWFNSISSIKSPTILPLVDIETPLNSVTALTYIYPILSTSNKNVGAIIFLIPNEFINYNVSQTVLSGDSDLYIVTEDFTVLSPIHQDDDNNLGNIFSEDVGSDKMEGNFQIGDKSIIYVRSPDTGLTFAYQIPNRVIEQEAYAIRTTLLWSLAVFFVLELALCLFFAFSNYEPIKNFNRNIRQLFPGHESSGEYELMEFSVDQIKSMKDNVIKSNTREKSLLLDLLLDGKYRTRDDLYPFFQATNISINGNSFCAVVISVNYNPERFSELLTEELTTITDGTIIYHIHKGNSVTGICVFENAITYEEFQVIQNVISDKIKDISKRIGIEFKVGIGKIYEEIVDVYHSYRQALNCVKNTSYNDIINFENIANNNSLFYFPTFIEQKLINSARQKQQYVVEETFDLIISENFSKRTLSESVADCLVSNLKATLLKIYEDTITENKETEELLFKVSNINSFEETLHAMKDEFVKLSLRQDEKKSSKQKLLLEKIYIFIHEHYSDPNIGVYMVASEFDLSESYFSQIFKDMTKETFSSYLENLRLEKARELLLGWNKNMDEIAESVGYTSSASFRRAFKRVYGVSPTDYYKNKDNNEI